MDNRAMSIGKRKIRILLVALMLAFIWGHSLLSGSASGRESEYVREFLEPLLTVLQAGLERIGIIISQGRLVRKLAHFAEFTALGFLVGILLEKENGRARVLLPEGLCVLAACVDELIQLFAADRGPSLRDVALDSGGAIVGVLLALTALCIRRLWKNRNVT